MVLRRPFSFAGLTLSSNVFYAPLAGCSDYPFRKMSAKYRPGLFFCEMVKMDALVRFDEGTFRLLDYDPSMHPLGAQLCGSKLELAADAARIVEDLGFDLLDFNCGCPVDKVTKDGSGSGMLKQLDRMGEILFQMQRAVKIPVTVKVRAGWDGDSICVEEATSIAEQAGAKAICVHGRTREQGYTGPANWEYIRRAKKAANKIQVIGNGDVFEPEDAKRLFDDTECDAILVARGTLGKPWIVEEILAYLQGEEVRKKGPLDFREGILAHFDAILSYQKEKQAVTDMRRVGCWYLKHCEGARALRAEINGCHSTEEILEAVRAFPWQGQELTSSYQSSCQSL